jgi:hypothetical protein
MTKPCLARIFLDDAMSPEEQKKTGVAGLSYQQRLALEQWLNDNYIAKSPEEEKKIDTNPLYLSQNIDNGKTLMLTDDSVWEVKPEDRSVSESWLTPFPLQVLDNTDPDKAQYPKKFVNLNTNAMIKVKMVRPPRRA